jgi:hypothetical protein
MWKGVGGGGGVERHGSAWDTLTQWDWHHAQTSLGNCLNIGEDGMSPLFRSRKLLCFLFLIKHVACSFIS